MHSSNSSTRYYERKPITRYKREKNNEEYHDFRLLQFSPIRVNVRTKENEKLKYINTWNQLIISGGVVRDVWTFETYFQMDTAWELWRFLRGWYSPELITLPSCNCTATPKPPTLTGEQFSLEANNIQWGLISRWMISFSWQYLIASMICLM